MTCEVTRNVRQSSCQVTLARNRHVVVAVTALRLLGLEHTLYSCVCSMLSVSVLRFESLLTHEGFFYIHF